MLKQVLRSSSLSYKKKPNLIRLNIIDSKKIICNQLGLNGSNVFPHMKRVTRKQTLRSLSLSYQKKDGHAWPRPSFFCYDTDFSEFDSADIIDYILEKSVSYQKKDGCGHACPSFFFFFWYDNDKDLKLCFLLTRVICH